MNYPNEITVRVRKRDIRRGVPFEPSRCPIALAVRRIFHKRVWVFLGERGVQVGVRVLYRLPQEAVEFADGFDAGKEGLPPFQFVAVKIAKGKG